VLSILLIRRDNQIFNGIVKQESVDNQVFNGIIKKKIIDETNNQIITIMVNYYK